MPRWQRSIVGVFLFVSFGFGWWAIHQADQFPNSSPSRTMAGSRDPAAIKRSYDFSDLEGMALTQASKQRLLAGVALMKEASMVGVELGHFVVKTTTGEKVFACSKYTKVSLVFEGDGMAVGGEKPEMEVEGACEVAADINRIAPVWIPVDKIRSEPVADGEFDFRDPHPVKIRFGHVADQWPKAWVLRSIRLQDESGAQVDVSPEEVKKFIPQPVIVNF